MMLDAYRSYTGVAVVAIWLVLYPFVVSSLFWLNVAVLAMIMASAAIAWNLLGGFTGQLSFGHSIFFGIGAYSVGFLLVTYSVNPWLGMAAGAAIACLAAVIIGFPAFRLKGHYFAIATLAAQQLVFVVVVNTRSLGSSSGLPLPTLAPSWAQMQFALTDRVPFHLIALLLLGMSAAAVKIFMRGRAGMYVLAIREDSDAAAAVGIPIRRYKLLAFALSGILTACAGSIYAMYALYVYPQTTLGVERTIQIALIAILGGIGTYWGPFIGAWALTILQQGARVQLSGGAATSADFVVWGLLLVLLAILEPRGLVGIAERLRSLVSSDKAPLLSTVGTAEHSQGKGES